jgi:carbamoyl-phosphate synthase large subunit
VPTDRRMWAVFRALERGWTSSELHELTKIDPWFLDAVRRDRRAAPDGRASVGLRDMSPDLLRTLKRAGFGDRDIAGSAAPTRRPCGARARAGARAAYKRIDTCAAEFESFTPYMYSTYEPECEADPTAPRKVVILGSGPNRIGQGIEFDYCCCHAAFAFARRGSRPSWSTATPRRCRPTTTRSDRLYFEPLTFEDVMAIIERERRPAATWRASCSSAGRRR